MCIDLAIWYFRLLHISICFRSLGPKLVMIKKMLKDLFFFILIITIFVFAYGISTHGKKNKKNLKNFFEYNNFN